MYPQYPALEDLCEPCEDTVVTCAKCGKKVDDMPESLAASTRILCSMSCTEMPVQGVGWKSLMPRFARALVACLVMSNILAAGPEALAQSKDFTPPPVLTLPPGEDRISPVRKGDPAPFDGQVFSTDTAIRWGFWLEQYQARLPLDVETQRQLGQVRIDYLTQAMQVEKERCEDIEKSYRDEIKELRQVTAQDRPFYDTYLFGFATGIVFTSLAVGLAAYGLTAAQ